MSGKIIKLFVFLLGILLIVESIILYSMGYFYIVYIVGFFLCFIIFDELPKFDRKTKLYKYESFKKKYYNFKNKKYLIYMDIDDFTFLKNEVSRSELNKILFSISSLMKKYFDNSILCRKYSDAFLICTEMDEKKVLKNINSLFNDIRLINVSNYSISCSFGISLCENDQISTAEWKAYIALKNAKKLYGNYYSIYDDFLISSIKENNSISNELSEVVKNKKPTIFFQPIYDIKTEKIVGAEALVRLSNSKGVTPACDFIDIARKSGYIKLIDKYVIKEVFTKIKEMKSNGVKFGKIYINISYNTIEDSTSLKNIKAMIQEYGISRHDIAIELSCFDYNIKNIVDVKNVINELSLYFDIILDNFGCNDSLLLLGKDINVNSIKIDKMFLNDFDKDNNKKIVKSIRDLVDDINISLMASYVETIEQYYYLKDLHFDKIQGYLFSKPLEYGDFIKKI